jgi:sarcosine oxidase subunit gamma
VQTGDPTVLWLAPDGWLAMSESVDAIRLCDELRAACGSRVAAAVDVSDSLVRFELSGASAWQLLARGCSVDFSPDRFASGQAIRTRLAQLAVIVHAPSAATLHIVVDRGPARWLRDWLVDAATGVNRRE